MAGHEPDEMTGEGQVDRYHRPGLSRDILGLRRDEREFGHQTDSRPEEDSDLEVILVRRGRGDRRVETGGGVSSASRGRPHA